MEEQKIHRRMFLLAFSATLLVFACLIGGAVYFLPTTGNSASNSAATSSTPPTSGYLPSREEALTLLVSAQESPQTPPDLFWLVGFEPLAGKLPVLALPTDLAVGERTLGQVWTEQGPDAAKQAVAQRLGVAVERYAALDRGSIQAIAKKTGAFSFALSYPVTLSGYGDTVVIQPGLQLLGGQRTADLVTYDRYPGGTLTHLQVAAELAGSALDQKWDMVLAQDAQGLLTGLLGQVETDLTAEDIAAHLQAARFVATLQVRSATVVPFSGHQDEQGRWVPDSTTLELAQKLYHAAG